MDCGVKSKRNENQNLSHEKSSKYFEHIVKIGKKIFVKMYLSATGKFNHTCYCHSFKILILSNKERFK